jgi:hypothetical protein
MNGIRPKSHNDALALKHDVEYLTSGEKFSEDWYAIKNSDWSMEGVAMKAGLSLRIIGDSLSHINPLIPKIHLNSKEDIDKEVLKEVKLRANKILKDFNLKID